MLRDARAGDPLALDQLFGRFRNYLGCLACAGIDRRLRTKADPSDIVQDTLLNAYAAFERFRGNTEGEFAAWLRRILSNQLAMLGRRYRATAARDVARERPIAATLEDSSQQLGRLADDAITTPSEFALRHERSLLLADALAALPPHYREVIVLRDLRQLEWPEVSDAMGRSKGAVRLLWSRALALLGRTLREESEP
jgi:RNA polymerase sigma-70 factor (ECF subfamily)